MKTLDEHIDVAPGVGGGKPRVAGHRITVAQVAVWHERMGMSPDEIAAGYGLTLADVHAALAYYFDHRADVDRSIAEDDAFAAELRAKTPSKLQDRLQELNRHDGATG